MNHGSLFSGIGGFDYAAEMMGWKNVFHCEIEPFPRKVLNYYWPDAKSYTDVTKTDFTIHRGQIDILTGGFPCQPYSVAGQRKGKDDDRHLWPEMLRAIREIQPRWIVGENVPGIVSWDGGLVFEEVCADLEAEGYEVQPVILPAISKDAPHRRDRVWFVAYRADTGFESVLRQGENGIHGLEFAPNPDNQRLEGGENERSTKGSRKRSHEQLAGCFCAGWSNFPTQSPVCSRNDGISTKLDGITFPKWRNESIKAYGNAIVPQVAFEIFKVIEKIENSK